jgi:cob(I)alamin adenosyltransferase
MSIVTKTGDGGSTALMYGRRRGHDRIYRMDRMPKWKIEN